MPRDYKNRAQSKPQRKPVPGWLWLLTGLLLGGFAVGLIWLQGQSADTGGGWVGAKPDRPPQGAQTPVPKPSPPGVTLPKLPEPRFDFYSTLPQMEVVIPDEELRMPAQIRSPAASAAPVPAAPPVAPPAPMVARVEPSSVADVPAVTAVRPYQLQIGSFSRGEDAERLRAQLALLGIEARVVSARIGSQDIRHRVRSGPYVDPEEMERVRQRLAANGFNALLMRAAAD